MTYAERGPSRQLTGAAGVVAIHAALILALVNGLAVNLVKPDEGVIKVVPVDNLKPFDEPPLTPLDDPRPSAGPLEIPEPYFPPELAPAQDAIVGEVAEHTNEGASGSAPTIAPPSPLRSDPRHPLEPPEYPASAIRRSQEGTVQLLIHVLPNGRVGDVKINRSSGFPVLDAAAMRKARAAWRFLPAASGGGQLIAAWGTLDVKFQLN